MLTVLEAIQLSTEYLEKKGIESPRLNAELLLADILNCKRFDLYLQFDKPIKEEEKNRYRKYLERRGNFEPIQYVLGYCDFYGLKLNLNTSVLIPRPETELLVETVIENVNPNDKVRILDVGTGSGNISIALAKNLSDIEITAIDISNEAIEIAKANAELNLVQNKINFSNIDINKFVLEKSDKFNFVVSNPPYVSRVDYPTLQKEIVQYEPEIALTDNSDGLEFYRIISKIANEILITNGKLFFEIGLGQSEKVKEIMSENKFTNIYIKKDYSKIDRIIFGEKE
ncbi:MAG: peptide chain release factor N(5)-glutamine methyltransferase [Ignavibacteriales bacterium]|nr:peptide chain release factor N(5)-glutamine methyltransferase [Ignavibacteriales bacterium]